MKEPSKRKLKTRENLNKLSILISMYKRRRRNYDTLLDFIDKERKNKKHPPKPSAAPKDIAITEEKLEDHVLSRHRREIENITSEIIELLRLGKRQKEAILPDSVDLVQAQNCQVDLTHALANQPQN